MRISQKGRKKQKRDVGHITGKMKRERDIYRERKRERAEEREKRREREKKRDSCQC